VSAYRVVADFEIIDKKDKKHAIQSELNTRFKTEEEARFFLEKCKNAKFTVDSVEKKPAKKSPSAPFTTSTLQQEASRKLRFSVSRTMMVAQQLYEAGFITYMRTDSVNLSNLALADAKKEISQHYGEEYSTVRKYTTKTKGAQEAHEAIRPSYMNRHTIDTSDNSQKRLYELIWKRTIASQMSDAKLEKTTVTTNISTTSEKFITEGEVLLFDGFLKVYLESRDDEDGNDEETKSLPPIKQGMDLTMEQIQAIEKFSQQPYRYTEASLVRKLEELGIGRPSTYAPTISTIQKREYVIRGDKQGFEREYNTLVLKKEKITQSTKKEKVGYEKGKLFPTDTGVIVNKFLIANFENVMNYNFTAKIEKEFDDIADGNRKWEEMISDFYATFHKTVTIATETSARASGERLVGIDPKSKKNVYAKLGRFGPIIQISDTQGNEKPQYAKILRNQSIETITLEEALELFKLPRTVGTHQNEELIVNIGKFGAYVRYQESYYSIPKTEDLMTISLERCIEIIDQKKASDAEKKPIVLGKHNDIDVSIAVGRYGPYVAYNKHFYSLPAGTDIKNVLLEEALDAMKKAEEKNNIKTFPENASIKILKGKYGAYITDGKKNYKISKDKTPIELTYEECLGIMGK
jgi:DNA topoisomerase-1